MCEPKKQTPTGEVGVNYGPSDQESTHMNDLPEATAGQVNLLAFCLVPEQVES